MNKKSIAAAVLVAALIGTGVTLAVVLPSGCSPDPAGSITATPAGDIWNGQGGCYNTPNGETLKKPITVENATFVDNSTTPTKVPGQYLGMHPVLTIKGANVTVQNVNITGGQVGGPKYIASMVAQAGIVTKSSVNTVIRNVTVARTFGDCLTLFQNGPRTPPTVNLLVDKFTCTDPGRFGVSPSDVYGATINDFTVTPDKSPKPAADFESDVKGLGASFVTFNRLSGKSVLVRESLGGPIVFNNANLHGGIALQNLNGYPYPVTFNGGSLVIGSGGSSVGVSAKGGVDTFNGMTFTRQPSPNGKPQQTSMWFASKGASLTFINCKLAPPLGVNDVTSTVTVTP